jgi:NADH:ubiquinone oxidoreductase subunit F (NADH-binding)
MTPARLCNFVVLFTLLTFPRPGSAQNTEGGIATTLPSPSAASYYYVAKPGEMTMQVNIWGDVQKPGRYEVGGSTDLIQLLSYAGGPTREAELSEVRITRFLEVDGVLQKKYFTVNLEDFSKTDDSKLALAPGDAVYVDYVTRINFRDLIAVLTAAALVTTAVYQIWWTTSH